MKVYLAGPITGLTYDEGQDWREYAKNKLAPEIAAYSPLRAKDYLKKHGVLQGSYDFAPLSSSKGITTRDRFDCMGSDLVLFNLLGAKQISIGTVMEFGWADAARRPIVLVAEDDNIHNHPMVEGVVGFRTKSLDDALHHVRAILLP